MLALVGTEVKFLALRCLRRRWVSPGCGEGALALRAVEEAAGPAADARHVALLRLPLVAAEAGLLGQITTAPTLAVPDDAAS